MNYAPSMDLHMYTQICVYTNIVLDMYLHTYIYISKLNMCTYGCSRVYTLHVIWNVLCVGYVCTK
jgi:hypothetical protein